MTDPLKGQTHALKPTEELMRELDAKRDNEPEPDDTPEGTDTQLKEALIN